MRRPSMYEFPPGSGVKYRVLDAGEVYPREQFPSLWENGLQLHYGSEVRHSGIRNDCRRCVNSQALKYELGALDAITGYEFVWVLETISEGPYAGQTLYVRWKHSHGPALHDYDDNGGPALAQFTMRIPVGLQTRAAKRIANARRNEWPSTEVHRNRRINRGTPRFGGRSRAGKMNSRATKKEDA